MVNVHVFNIGIICIHGEELLRQVAFHQEVSEQSDEIYGVKTLDWENSSWKYLSLIGDEQVISLSGLRILKFCIVSWKDTREPSVKYCMGRQIDVVQKFTRVQSFEQN